MELMTNKTKTDSEKLQKKARKYKAELYVLLLKIHIVTLQTFRSCYRSKSLPNIVFRLYETLQNNWTCVKAHISSAGQSSWRNPWRPDFWPPLISLH